jgi:hypothetical protein
METHFGGRVPQKLQVPLPTLPWQAHINQTFNLGGQGDCSLQEEAEEENEDEGEAARERE